MSSWLLALLASSQVPYELLALVLREWLHRNSRYERYKILNLVLFFCREQKKSHNMK